ncbi:TPA: hypothetical protein ACH3X2_011335 [Trebouxia sp. C0005]
MTHDSKKSTRSKVAEKMATACDLTSMVTPELVCSSFYAVVAGITPEYVATCTLSRSLGYFADANAHMYKQQLHMHDDEQRFPSFGPLLNRVTAPATSSSAVRGAPAALLALQRPAVELRH